MGFPSRYLQGPGALFDIGQLLRDLGFQRPAILCDKIVRDAVLPRVEGSLKGADLPVNMELFPGEITPQTVVQCNLQIKARQPDVVLGLGGGKAVDAAKAAAASLNIPVVVAPTVASNDAPTSRLIVINDSDNTPLELQFLTLNPMAVVVDTEIIVQAPPRFFAAGIGDAVSKRLEARQCLASGGLNFFGTPPSSTAILMADHCYEVILKHASDAFRAVCAQNPTDAVEEIVEATVLLSGLGFENGGLSLGHSLIRGIIAIPAMRGNLHGEMVAFGAFVQMVAEDASKAEIDQLLHVLISVNLPVTFEGLGLSGPLSAPDLDKVVQATLAHAYARNMTPALTSARLADALRKTDEIGTRKSEQMAK